MIYLSPTNFISYKFNSPSNLTKCAESRLARFVYAIPPIKFTAKGSIKPYNKFS